MIGLLRRRLSLSRGDAAAVALAILSGIILSALPHILWFFKTGDPAWIADHDDLAYLVRASAVYHGFSFRAGDPLLGGAGTTIFPWFQCVPAAIMARLMGLDPMHISIIWRVWAGLGLSLSCYILTRAYLKSPWLALAATVVFMADIGALTSWLIIKQVVGFARIASGNPGHLLNAFPALLQQWRVPNAGVIFPFLLIYLWSLRRVTEAARAGRIALAAFCFGLLFYVYFYFWTAAGLALWLGIILDSRNRQTYFLVGALGTSLGLPHLLKETLLKSSLGGADMLLRSDYWLPIARFSEFLFPKMTIALLFLSMAWVWRRRKELFPLWALGAAGILLANHQVVTGVQTQNFHWIAFCAGPITSLLVLILALSLAASLRWTSKRVMACGGLVALHLAAGIWLRSIEAARTKTSVHITSLYHQYRQQRRNAAAPRLAAGAVMASPAEFLEFSVIAERQHALASDAVFTSPSVNNAEWFERLALDGYLQGESPSGFLERQAGLLSAGWGPWSRNPRERAATLITLKNNFIKLEQALSPALQRFQVRYVALPIEARQPACLKKGWKIHQDGPYWRIWERAGANS